MNDEAKTQEQALELTPPWSPSSTLHARLLVGVLAVLTGCALTVAATILGLLQNNLVAPGFTLATGLRLAGTLLLLVVFAVYHRIGTEVESPSLKKLSVCLGLLLLIGSILEFADSAVVPVEWVTALLIAGGLGLVPLLIVAFVYPRPKRADAPEEAASETSDKAKAGAGIGGGLVFMILIGLKVGARVLFRQGRGLGFEELVAIAGLVLLLLTVTFLIWFGAAKIRLRGKLGSLGLVLGIYEILVAVAALVAVIALVVALVGAEDPNLNAQQAEQAVNDVVEAWTHIGAQVQIVVEILWALLTACFFAALRNRHEPDLTLPSAAL